MVLIRPRLNDFFDIPITQEMVDFAIPYLDEDIPFFLDPFLLWKSPSQQDNSLHLSITNTFNNLGKLVLNGEDEKAISILIKASECDEVGLGNSKTRRGKPIGQKKASEILSLYNTIPQLKQAGIVHFETIQFFVEGISKDRISDFSCNFIKSFLIDFTIDQCNKYNIPLQYVEIDVFDMKTNNYVKEKTVLPINPETNEEIILIPKRWLRHSPWINLDDYSNHFLPLLVKEFEDPLKSHISVLSYNRSNYDVVQLYIEQKEKSKAECKNEPIFTPISVYSARRKTKTVLTLPTGNNEKADKIYEDNVSQFLSSVLFPQLDFACVQSRTESGSLIRDLIFYNNRSNAFLQDIYSDYESRQIVFELKNVREVEREHINQLNRYLCDSFGKFGIIFTRNPPPKKIFQNTIDLWSGQRRCILVLTDADLKMMCEIFEDKQRDPIEVIKMKYLDFIRKCPS